MNIFQQASAYYKSHKWARVTSYVLLVLIGLYLVLLTILSVYINANKQKFISQVNTQIQANILGDVKVESADITVWSSFPRIAVVLQNVSITDSVYHKPFLKLRKASTSFGLTNLIGKNVQIGRVDLEGGLIHIFTDGNGYNNTYVIKNNKQPDTTGGKKKSLLIKNLSIKNVVFLNEHKIKNKKHLIKIRDLDAEIKEKEGVYTINLDEDVLVKGLGFNLAKGAYLNNQVVKASWKIIYNTNERSMAFGNTKVMFNDHPLMLKGKFYLKDNPRFSLHIDTKGLPYSQGLKLLPQNVQEKLGTVTLTKPVDIIADIIGPMAYKTTPMVKVQFLTTLTRMITPVTELDSCTFNGSFTNQKAKNLPISNENSAVEFNSFIGTWGDIALTGQNILVSNLVNPNLQFQFQSQCTFPQLDEQLSLRTIRFIQGNAKLALEYNGPLITDPQLLSKLQVDLKMEDGIIEYEPRGLQFTDCNGQILFSENTLLAKNLQCNVKSNHFVVNIEGSDLSRLSSNVSGKADIVCSVYSPALNLGDFMAVFSAKKTVNRQVSKKQKLKTTSTLQIDKILEEGSLQLDLQAKAISLKNFKARNARAQLLFEENSWQIQRAYLQHSNGSMDVSAKILENSAQFRDASLKAIFKNIDAKNLFYSFNNFGQTGIEYNNIQGLVNSNVNVAVRMNDKGDLLPGSMKGVVDFSIKKGALINFEPIQRIQKFAFKNKDLSRIEFAELKNKLEINGFDITINRMEIESSVLKVYVEGVYSLKNNTDISIQVPISNMQKKEEDYKPENVGVNARVGPSIFLRARPDKDGNIKVGLDLFKKFKKDKDSKDEDEEKKK